MRRRRRSRRRRRRRSRRRRRRSQFGRRGRSACHHSRSRASEGLTQRDGARPAAEQHLGSDSLEARPFDSSGAVVCVESARRCLVVVLVIIVVVVIATGSARSLAAALLTLGHEGLEVAAVFAEVVSWASAADVEGSVFAQRARVVLALDVLARSGSGGRSRGRRTARVVATAHLQRRARRRGGANSSQYGLDGSDGFESIHASAGAKELVVQLA